MISKELIQVNGQRSLEPYSWAVALGCLFLNTRAAVGLRQESVTVRGGEDVMKWAMDAERALARVPFFVRQRVKRRVEAEVVRRGSSVVLLEHVHDCRKRYLADMEAEVRGFQVETCFGPGGCANRASGTEGTAEKVEELMNRKDMRGFLRRTVQGPLKFHHEFRVSVSDCPNACSRPQIADVGLIGACEPVIIPAGDCSHCEACVEACRERAVSMDDSGPLVDPVRCLRCGQCIDRCPLGVLTRGRQGFRIQVGGKLGRHPLLGRELQGIYSLEETLAIVERCVDFYMSHCIGGERFGEVLNRVALEI